MPAPRRTLARGNSSPAAQVARSAPADSRLRARKQQGDPKSRSNACIHSGVPSFALSSSICARSIVKDFLSRLWITLSVVVCACCVKFQSLAVLSSCTDADSARLNISLRPALFSPGQPSAVFAVFVPLHLPFHALTHSPICTPPRSSLYST